MVVPFLPSALPPRCKGPGCHWWTSLLCASAILTDVPPIECRNDVARFPCAASYQVHCRCGTQVHQLQLSLMAEVGRSPCSSWAICRPTTFNNAVSALHHVRILTAGPTAMWSTQVDTTAGRCEQVFRANTHSMNNLMLQVHPNLLGSRVKWPGKLRSTLPRWLVGGSDMHRGRSSVHSSFSTFNHNAWADVVSDGGSR